MVSRFTRQLRHDCVISNDLDVGLEKDCGIVTKGFIERNGNVCSKTVGRQEFRLVKTILQEQKWLTMCKG